jgi:hypothetical protein
MAKFYGEIGFNTGTVESPADSGVWVDVIVEKLYFGDVIRNSRQLREGVKINDDLSVNNSISIVADPYAYENFFAMRYIRWMGTLWIVSTVDVQRPRLLLSLGGVYHGPTAGTPESAQDYPG